MTYPKTEFDDTRPTRSYDFENSLDQCIVTDEEGHKSLFQYDGRGHLIEVIKDYGGLNVETLYRYDEFWRLNKRL